jgi:hypothetical protein
MYLHVEIVYLEIETIRVQSLGGREIRMVVEYIRYKVRATRSGR